MRGGVNSSLNNLMKLELRNCKECLHLPSLGLLPNIQFLEISWIKKVKRMGSKFYVDQSNSVDGVGSATQFPALREFRVVGMDSLEEWVEVEGVIVFPCLERLYIKDCPKLKTWSMDGFSSNHKLSSLSISGCHKLMAIPSMDGLSSLKAVSIAECYKLMSVPSGLGSCTSLRELTVHEYQKLSSIQSINGLTSLTSLDLSCCYELLSLPSGLGSCASLQKLVIVGCISLSSIQSINGLTSLTSLDLSFCSRLMSLPSGLGSCICLQELTICRCRNLSSIPSINGFTSLRTLELCNCDELMSLPSGLGSCTSLQSVVIWGCHNIISITEEIGELHSLSQLEISDCEKLRSIPEECVGRLTCLKRLRIGGFCSELEEFSGLTYIRQLHASLEVLDLNGWDKLKSLPRQLQHLTALKELILQHFNGLKALPEWLGDLSNLQYLRIFFCPKLDERCTKESGPDWAKISHIPNIEVNYEYLQGELEGVKLKGVRAQ